MGHIFVLCGPPGAGKTTLLKTVANRQEHIPQLRRLTTRKARTEEGDKSNKSLEYEFLKPPEFAERIARGRIASLIEWNGNYYATEMNELEKSFNTSDDYLLLEDIPSAVHLKQKYPTNVTVVFLFTANRDEIVNGMDFASYDISKNEYLARVEEEVGNEIQGRPVCKGPDTNQ